jgi:hypothetical protein
MSKKINISGKVRGSVKGKNEEPERQQIKNNVKDESIIPFEDFETLDDDKIFIECPGASVYEEGTRNVIAGVEFVDDAHPEKGYRVVDQQVFAPEHRKRRLIKKEHRSSIRRCQACQDLTVRLIRREGVDFFIPSPKHPRKTKLKSIENNWAKNEEKRPDNIL